MSKILQLIAKVDVQATEIFNLKQERDRLVTALENLANKLEEINDSPEYNAMCWSFINHGGVYNGPTYSKELEVAHAAIKECGL